MAGNDCMCNFPHRSLKGRNTKPHETLCRKTPDQKTRLLSGPEETPLPQIPKGSTQKWPSWLRVCWSIGLLKDTASVPEEPMKEFLSTRKRARYRSPAAPPGGSWGSFKAPPLLEPSLAPLSNCWVGIRSCYYPLLLRWAARQDSTAAQQFRGWGSSSKEKQEAPEETVNILV